MIGHLDMDAFFASVEQRENPEYRRMPVIVGGGARGVVTSASYEARALGIYSSMPLSQARKMCPHGVFLKNRISLYARVSRVIFEILNSLLPVVERASIDEAYFDLSGTSLLYSDMGELARTLQSAVSEATDGLSCSIGIAPRKFLAKICSEVKKPGGFFVLPEGEIQSFLDSLSIEMLPGVGRRMASNLHSFGIFRVEDLKRLSIDFLQDRFGKTGLKLFRLAQAIDDREVSNVREPLSESSECTFSEDVHDREILYRALLLHSEKVSERLRINKLEAKVVGLKLKFSDFTTLSRSRTLSRPTASSSMIYDITQMLLNALSFSLPVRLIGIVAEKLEEPFARDLLPGLASPCISDGIDTVMDKIRNRYGFSAISRASIQGLSSNKP